jgi:hypothetical protein
MNIYLAKPFLILAYVSLLTACSVAKIEARLEANPQCKDIVNPKTGALMPCPGSDKSFYREVGLAPQKSVTANTQTTSAPGAVDAPSSTPGSSSVVTMSPVSPAKTVSAPADCKPQIHKKTGGTLPCPSPD